MAPTSTETTTRVDGDALRRPHRRHVDFEAAALDPRWNPRCPEFAAVANSVSLLMPHIEPYFIRSTRTVLDRLEPALRRDATGYMGQEAQHQAQHRAYNTSLISEYPALAFLDRMAARVYRALERRWSPERNVAFAAASEAIAYCIARWTHDHYSEVVAGASGGAADLFVWHLAEEVEHRSVAFDIDRVVNRSRWRYVAGGVVSLLVLAAFAIAGTSTILASDRRLLSPMTWVRLTRWAFSFWFVVAPALAVSSLADHDPRRLVEPVLYAGTLRRLDELSGGQWPAADYSTCS